MPMSTTLKNVLIIGDSVSLGYTPSVAALMSDVALVQHVSHALFITSLPPPPFFLSNYTVAQHLDFKCVLLSDPLGAAGPNQHTPRIQCVQRFNHIVVMIAVSGAVGWRRGCRGDSVRPPVLGLLAPVPIRSDPLELLLTLHLHHVHITCVDPTWGIHICLPAVSAW